MAIDEKSVDENQHLTPGKGKTLFTQPKCSISRSLAVDFDVLTPTSTNISLPGPK